MTTQHAKSNAREGDGVAGHVSVLEEMLRLGTPPCCFALEGDEIAALTAAIAAMQAQQGAVEHRWVRDGVPQGQWVGGQPSPRQFQAASDCARFSTWTVEYRTGAPR